MDWKLVAAATAVFGAGEAFAQDPIPLGDVVIENQARDQRLLLDTPTAATVLDAEDIERRGADSFEELLGDVPNVLIEGGPRAAAQEPNIRGFADEQIVLRVDGGRMNFNQAHRGRFFIDPDILQRVEVVRGGGSTLQGSGALGGVISLETKSAFDLLDEGETHGARLRTSIDSNGLSLGNTVTVYSATGDFDVLGFAAYRDMRDDMDDGDGNDIRASEMDVVNGLAKVGWNLNADHRIEGVFSAYVDDGITPSALDDVANAGNIVDRDASVLTGRLKWDFNPGDGIWDLSVLGYGNFLTVEEERVADGRLDTTDFDTYGFEAVNRSHVDLGLPVDIVVGAEVLRDEQSGTRDGAARLQFPDASVTSYATFAEATVEVTDTLTITPGIRLERFELRAAGQPDRNELEILPRVAASWRPVAGVQIYGNYGRNFRTPSLTELFADDVHFAVNGFALGPGQFFTGVNQFVPNPDLKEETSNQFELGARFSRSDVLQEGDAVSISGSGYYADVKDFIALDVTFIDFATARFDPVSGQVLVDGTTTSRNIDAKLWGGELEARYDTDMWWLSLSGSAARGKEKGGATLGSLPQDRLSLTAAVRPLTGLELGGRATIAAARNSGGVNSPAYEEFDLFASYAPEDGVFDGFKLSVGVDNILDEQFNIHPNALPQPGRNFKAALSYTINF